MPKKQSKAVTMCTLCPHLAKGEDGAAPHVRAIFVDDDVFEVIDESVLAMTGLVRVIFHRGAV